MLSFTTAATSIPCFTRPRAPLGRPALPSPMGVQAPPPARLALDAPAGSPPPGASVALPPRLADAVARSLPAPLPPLHLLVIADRAASGHASAVGAAVNAAATSSGLGLTVTPVVAASKLPRVLRPFMFAYLKALGAQAVVDTGGWVEEDLGYGAGALGLALVSDGRLAWQRQCAAGDAWKGEGQVDAEVGEVLDVIQGLIKNGTAVDVA